jgi:hypothetical protein
LDSHAGVVLQLVLRRSKLPRLRLHGGLLSAVLLLVQGRRLLVLRVKRVGGRRDVD